MLGKARAKQMADKSANSARRDGSWPQMCADKFRQASDSTLNMLELKKVSSWMQIPTSKEGAAGRLFPARPAPERGVAPGLARNLITALK